MKIQLEGLGSWQERAHDAAKIGVEKNEMRIESHAKKLAPIRKVFPGAQGDQPTRHMTKPEMKEVADIFRGMKSLSKEQRRGALASLKANPYIAMPSRANRLSRTGIARREITLLNRSAPLVPGRTFEVFPGQQASFANYRQLSSQGRAELKRGIRDYENKRYSSLIRVPITQAGASGETSERLGVTYQVQLGGRLKRDIQREAPEMVGKLMQGNVTSNAPYSRFVEFPTRRTRAQPFLRPALKAQQTKLQADLAAAYRAELQG